MTPLDVLLLVNYLNSNLLGGGKSAGTFSFDVNRDGFVDPLDVLVAINAINTGVANMGEGEGPTTAKQRSVDNFFAAFANEPSRSGEESSAVAEVFAELADELSIATKNQPFSQGGWSGCDFLIATFGLSY